jgi:hypothetical protein
MQSRRYTVFAGGVFCDDLRLAFLSLIDAVADLLVEQGISLVDPDWLCLALLDVGLLLLVCSRLVISSKKQVR